MKLIWWEIDGNSQQRDQVDRKTHTTQRDEFPSSSAWFAEELDAKLQRFSARAESGSYWSQFLGECLGCSLLVRACCLVIAVSVFQFLDFFWLYHQSLWKRCLKKDAKIFKHLNVPHEKCMWCKVVTLVALWLKTILVQRKESSAYGHPRRCKS